MLFKRLIYFFIIFIFFVSCSKENLQKSTIEETNLELQMIEAYTEGVKALENGDVLFAAKKFNESEILFPQSDIAPKSALMASYSYYSQNYYADAIAELDRFLIVYPNHSSIPYAKYLLALCYYEQIVDEEKDLNFTEKSKQIFLDLIKKYPNTEFATDAHFKLGLINDVLASKEMYVGRYYTDKKKWIAAINRFKFVIDKYSSTIYVEEAIHRLVEIYYILGLENEANKYANLLGYNYQSSEWYEKTYTIFNKNYQISKIKKEDNGILRRFKSLLK